MSSNKWTKNPTLPKRYRPGKGEDLPSDDDYSEDEDEVDEQHTIKAEVAPRNPSSAVRALPKPAPAPQPTINEDEFETESEDESGIASARDLGASGTVSDEEEKSEQGDTESSEEDNSDEESESSSENEAPKLMRPTFIRKDQRNKIVNSTGGRDVVSNSVSISSAHILSAQSTSEALDDTERRRKEADALVQEQIEKQAAARAAGKKYWDDDDDNLSEEVDDTDGIDPEAELAAWKLRELKRVKRARDAIEAAEKEREEIERRRGLTAEEREREDAEHLDKQREERQDRGQAGYMKRYFHRGAFYQDGDDETTEALRRRDVMGAKFADETNREILPEYMQIRDMAKLGRKGRSKYKDLRSEDTGRWGQDLGPKRERWTGDERFAPDRDRTAQGPERSGANAAPIGERQRRRSRSKDSRKRSRSPRPKEEFQDDFKRRRREEVH